MNKENKKSFAEFEDNPKIGMFKIEVIVRAG
jgi:hypothetical protein